MADVEAERCKGRTEHSAPERGLASSCGARRFARRAVKTSHSATAIVVHRRAGQLTAEAISSVRLHNLSSAKSYCGPHLVMSSFCHLEMSALG